MTATTEAAATNAVATLVPGPGPSRGIEKKEKFTPDKPVSVAITGSSYLRDFDVIVKALLAFRIWPSSFVLGETPRMRANPKYADEGIDYIVNRYLQWRRVSLEGVDFTDKLVEHVYGANEQSIGMVVVGTSGSHKGIYGAKANHQMVKKADVLLCLMSEYAIFTVEQMDAIIRARHAEMPVFIYRSPNAAFSPSANRSTGKPK
jgi:hypothetical protein